jgi:hypothetical protein
MQTVHTDSLSGALTVLFTFTIDRGVTWEVLFFLEYLLNMIVMLFKYNPNLLSTCVPILHVKVAKTMLDERQKDGAGSSNDGFFESKREWMGRRHFLLAFEGYVPDGD